MKTMAITRPTLFSSGREDPLEQLDTYCRAKYESGENSSDAVDSDELLSVAEFIFGHKTLSSALAIVDSHGSLVTKLVAPSGRFVHAIRSSSTATPPTGSSFQLSGTEARNDDEYYFCLLSPSQSSRSIPPLRYCSCRSFLEKSTKKASASIPDQTGSDTGVDRHNYSNDENHQDGPPICKHLLAIFLLPHLVLTSTSNDFVKIQNNRNQSCFHCPEIKSVSEENFASLILNKIL